MCAVLGERKVLPCFDGVFLALVADHALAVEREDQRLARRGVFARPSA